MKKRGALLLVLMLPALLCAACFSRMVSMPGASYAGPPAQANGPLEQALKADVTHLATTIGERNVENAPAALEQTAQWLTGRLRSFGYEVRDEPYPVGERTVKNLVVEKRGETMPTELVVVGAHYDTAPGTPGADDNGSGVAVALALAERFATKHPARTVRFVFFTNEEPPFFNTRGMGSEVNARAARARGDDVKAMLSLETMGFFRDEPNTQHYPWPLSTMYPSTGNFIAFVGDTESRALVHQVITTFRANAKVPSEGADWSDHGPYWRQGYRALMVTDTAPFRNPGYHEASDTADQLDYRRLALVTDGLVSVLDALAN